MAHLLTHNKRSSLRRPVSFKVQHTDPKTHKPATDYAKDLSEGGLFIRTKRIRPLGAKLEVEFPFAQSQQNASVIRAVCHVTRVTPDGIAATFMELDAESQSQLLQLLNEV